MSSHIFIMCPALLIEYCWDSLSSRWTCRTT